MNCRACRQAGHNPDVWQRLAQVIAIHTDIIMKNEHYKQALVILHQTGGPRIQTLQLVIEGLIFTKSSSLMSLLRSSNNGNENLRSNYKHTLEATDNRRLFAYSHIFGQYQFLKLAFFVIFWCKEPFLPPCIFLSDSKSEPLISNTFKGVLHPLPKITLYCALSQNNQHLLEK